MKFFARLLIFATSLGYCENVDELLPPSETFLHINLPRNTGMFSIFNYVVGVLHHYENTPFAGLEVDFMNSGLYYDESRGPNWWQYYCKPIKLGSKENAITKCFTPSEYRSFASFVEQQLDRQQVNALIQKYIKVHDNIQEKIDKYALENFIDCHMIGVHYRGTDKKWESEILPPHYVGTFLARYIKKRNITNYKIFLATDELEFVQYLNKAFPKAVITYSTQYSTDKNKPIHLYAKDKYLQGEEALIDCILLSQCDVLIRTSSNLSLWSTYFNPTLPQFELSKRHVKNRKPVS